MNSVFKTPEGKKIIMDRYHEILGYWPQPNEQRTVPTSYGKTFVVASGKEDGDAVVLLHGSTTNAAMWMGDAPILGKTHRVYAVDIIGEPGNSDENRPDHTGTNYAKWLSELFDGLGIKKATLVGNSLGGWMALAFAAYAPDRVNNLILLAPAGLAPVRTSFFFKAMFNAMRGEKGAARLNKLLFGDVTIPEEATAFGRLLREHYIPRPAQKLPVYTDEQLKKLDMPVLFFGGENDPLINIPQSVTKLRRLVPHADIRVLNNKAHTLINLGCDMAAFINKKDT